MLLLYIPMGYGIDKFFYNRRQASKQGQGASGRQALGTPVMDVRMLTVGPVAENCFVFRADGSDRGLIVDPGEEAERILAAVEELGIGVDAILLTHTHFDHVGAVAPVARADRARPCTARSWRCRCWPTSWPSSPGRASARTRATTPTRRSPAARCWISRAWRSTSSTPLATARGT